jgi:hypothetical protein
MELLNAVQRMLQEMKADMKIYITNESRNNGRTDASNEKYSRLPDIYPPIRDRSHPRRNNNQDGRASEMSGSLYECLGK